MFAALRQMRRSRVHALRLRHLWLAYLLAMLFHVELGLMPLFHGVSPEIESHVPKGSLAAVFWAMLIYFLIPLFCLVLIAYDDSVPSKRRAVWWQVLRQRWRASHLVISILYTFTNVPHLIADIVVPDSRGDQVFLMVILLVIGLLINRESLLWWRAGSVPRALQSLELKP